MTMQTRIKLANVERARQMRTERAVEVARLYQQGWRPRPPWHSRMRERAEFVMWLAAAVALIAIGIWS